MSKLKTIWNNMKARCKRPTGKNKCYRQISYTQEWEYFTLFKEWALKSGYREGLSIDRIDSAKNYEPSNCRWILLKRQARNKKGFGLSSFKGVVASKVKINALVSVIAVLTGGALWGVAGMFLSIPITAIIKVICDHIDSLKPIGFLLGDTMPEIVLFKISSKKNNKPQQKQ